MKKLRNVLTTIFTESGAAKYVIFGAFSVLLIAMVNPWILIFDQKYLIFFYPIFWLVWIVICSSSTAPVFRSTMQIAWVIEAVAVLLTLLAGALLNDWSTSRKYVVMQDLTALSLAPFCFPAGMIPDFLGSAIELIPFVGNGAVHRFEISHGLGIFVVLTWAKYCCATLFETWAILVIVDRIRNARNSRKPA